MIFAVRYFKQKLNNNITKLRRIMYVYTSCTLIHLLNACVCEWVWMWVFCDEMNRFIFACYIHICVPTLVASHICIFRRFPYGTSHGKSPRDHYCISLCREWVRITQKWTKYYERDADFHITFWWICTSVDKTILFVTRDVYFQIKTLIEWILGK